MKKLSLILVLILSFTIVLSTVIVTYAAELPINIVVNEKKLNFPDAKPFLDSNGRSQAPAKFIGEALGATVIWNGKEKQAVLTLGSKKLVLYIGRKNYIVNGQTKQMDTTAILKDERTFVPAKYIAEAFGANVIWNGTSRTVYVITKKTSTPQPEKGKDIAAGTVVNNYDEFVDALSMATYTLQPKVVLKYNNFNKSDFSLDNLGLAGVSGISSKASISKDVADITVTMTYSQVYKIQQAMSNSMALSRLSNGDIAVVNKMKDIISKVIKEDMTDYEKELAIHDYLVLNYKYDYDNYLKDTIPSQSYTSYGLLINGTGVCQAYAETTKLLLNAVGIECEMVTGTANGGDHAWNIVELDNEYYMLDVTWDDPVPDEQGKVRHNYFNVTTDQLSQDHIWDRSNWPIANGTKYHY
ncbi:MAG TPA: stalk domain-containing protein [Ruminiclostridium sp.]